MPFASLLSVGLIAGLAGLLLLMYRAAAQNRPSQLTQDQTLPSGSMDSMGGNPVKLTDTQQQMVQLITDEANRASINPAFMVALAVTESSLNPTVLGDDGKSIGLFQLTLDTVHGWNPEAQVGNVLDPEQNAVWAMLDIRKYITDFPGHTYADYAEAWTLGASGRFRHGKRNPQKVQHLIQALSDLGYTLNVNEVPT